MGRKSCRYALCGIDDLSKRDQQRGHDQYFLNVENTGDLQKEMAALETVLSEKLQKNLRDAYRAYQQLTDSESDEDTEAILEQCDDIFYQNEAEINCILKEYAAKMKL